MKNTIEYIGPNSCRAERDDAFAQVMRICGEDTFQSINLRKAPENDNNPPATGGFDKMMRRVRAALQSIFSESCAEKRQFNHCPRHGVSCPRFSPIK